MAFKTDMITKCRKLYYYFDSYNKRKDAIQEAYEYKELYKGSKYIIIEYYTTGLIQKKKYALFMTKVIKILR